MKSWVLLLGLSGHIGKASQHSNVHTSIFLFICTMNDSFFDTLIEPTLLLDEQRCRQNIKAMYARAKNAGVSFRPHFKTHQSHEVGRWFREEGVDKITVSSLRMAEYFAADGWADITVAFPVNIREINRINDLASKIKLNVLIENERSIQYLAQHLLHPIGAFLKIDIGYHRTGLDPKDEHQISSLLKTIDHYDKIKAVGLLGHAGHSYKARGKAAIHKIHKESLALIRSLKEKLQTDYPELLISVGDTPTCSWEQHFPQVDEIRPGNFVFYDLAQWRIGSCRFDQIAVAMACPIVAKHPDRQQLVIYGGGVHFAKDQSKLLDGKTTYYGHVVPFQKGNWGLPNGQNYIASLSQEHGIVQVQADIMNQYQVGDFITILPIHSCMAANAMKSYRTLDGKILSRL